MFKSILTKFLDDVCRAWHPDGLGRYAQRPGTFWLARFGLDWFDLAAIARIFVRLAARLGCSILAQALMARNQEFVAEGSVM